jgi:hypothetical protein
MIREANPDDLDLIVELAREAHTGSAWEGLAEFDPDSVREAAQGLIDGEHGTVLVSTRGVLMLARFPLWFNKAETLTTEVFFYATEGGDALRRAGERWADGLIVMCRHAHTDPRLDRLYERAGYRPLEHVFARRV